MKILIKKKARESLIRLILLTKNQFKLASIDFNYVTIIYISFRWSEIKNMKPIKMNVGNEAGESGRTN